MLPIRSGTDIAFLGGMIKYILDKNLYHREYVQYYTNAPFLVSNSFKFKDGLFSGFDEKTRKYDKSQWAFKMDANGVPQMDRSLKNSRSVFQLLKKHFARYNPQKSIGDNRNTAKRAFGDLQNLHGHRQTRQGGHHHVRHGLDPAHRWCSEYSSHGHDSAAVGQHGGCRRRGQRPARGVQRTGFHRSLPAVAHLARLPENPPGFECIVGGLQRQVDAPRARIP